MPWVRIDDSFTDNAKIAEVGPLGIALWVAGLAYCNRNLTDGFIPWAVAERLLTWQFMGPKDEAGEGPRKIYDVDISCGMHGDRATSDFVAHLLVSAGLWDHHEGGYSVHDYLDFQPSKQQVLRDRELSGARVKRHRNALRNGVTNGNVTVVPVPVSVTEEENLTPLSDGKPSDERASVQPQLLTLEALKNGTHRFSGARAKPRTSEVPEPEGFAAWYESYPRHEARLDAAKAYRAMIKSQWARETLEANTPLWVKRWFAQDRDERHVKLPATFLRSGTWQEPPEED